MTEFEREFQEPMNDLTAYFGELVVYRFRGGGQRSFDAIVNREPPAFYDPGGNVIQPEFVVSFPNDRATGAMAEEIDIGDQIELIPERGGTKRRAVAVLKLIRQDGGACEVACKGP